MKRPEHKDVIYFLGPEVEHTPAFSKRTLFVIGQRPTAEILQVAKEQKVQHIYLGANRSFSIQASLEDNITAADNINALSNQVEVLLNENYYVTLDYPVVYHTTMVKYLSPAVWQSRLFVPFISVEIPHLSSKNPNLTIKIDDSNMTNDGVWCWNQHELMDSNKFTGWGEYADDVIIPTPDSIPVPEIKKEGPHRIEKMVEVPKNISIAQTADLYAGNTTSVSIDSADADNEPELVARKTVRLAKSKKDN
jgi:hypothetical protein